MGVLLLMASHATREKYALPPRPFLYTLDQIATILAYPNEKALHKSIFFEGRTLGGRPRKDLMIARNIAPDDQQPEWRVEEEEFIRWMRHMKILPMQRTFRY